MRLTERGHRVIIAIMFISGFIFGLTWPYVVLRG